MNGMVASTVQADRLSLSSWTQLSFVRVTNIQNPALLRKIQSLYLCCNFAHHSADEARTQTVRSRLSYTPVIRHPLLPDVQRRQKAMQNVPAVHLWRSHSCTT